VVAAADVETAMNNPHPIAEPREPTFRLLENGDVKCLLCKVVVQRDKLNQPDRCCDARCPVKGVDHE
jgi:hypothetical protein